MLSVSEYTCTEIDERNKGNVVVNHIHSYVNDKPALKKFFVFWEPLVYGNIFDLVSIKVLCLFSCPRSDVFKMKLDLHVHCFLMTF